tara:strand:+ start:9429 stop:9536 length:108 start_codon:yes stop_codon:yes gene_type:complete
MSEAIVSTPDYVNWLFEDCLTGNDILARLEEIAGE